MIWFLRQRFEYPPSVANPVGRLREVLADPKWGKVASEVSPEKVVIERKLSAFFYNSWNPIFEGKFAFDGQRPCLVGHFRVHWY